MSTPEALQEAKPAAEPADDLPAITRYIRNFVDHPITKLVIGLILIVTSSAEAYYNLDNDLHHFRLRAHHGLLVLGFINVLAAIPGLVEGVEHYLAFREKARTLLRSERKARESRS